MSENMESPRAFQVHDADGVAVAGEGAAQEHPPEPPPALSIEATLAGKLSLSDFQNAVPLLRELTLVSTSPDDTTQLELSLTVGAD